MSLPGLKGGHVLLSWVRNMNPASKIVVDDEQDMVKVTVASTDYRTSTETV